MGSRDRPGKEAKKKQKAKLAEPQPRRRCRNHPQNVEVIRKPRKEKPVVVEDDTEEG